MKNGKGVKGVRRGGGKIGKGKRGKGGFARGLLGMGWDELSSLLVYSLLFFRLHRVPRFVQEPEALIKLN